MQSSLPARCGMNIPYYAYLDSIGKKLDPSVEIKEHLKWAFIGEDFRSALKSYVQGDLSLLEWFKSYRGTIEFSIIASDDMKPFFYSLLPYYH
jgi:hypothetical protein